MKLLFVGHEDFGNRGCEALIRSITGIVRAKDPATQLLCPSRDLATDRQRWPGAEDNNLSFVVPSLFPAAVRWWGRFAKYVPGGATLWPRPRFTPDAPTRAAIADADALIVTGGDILGLEYGLPSLYHWMGLIDWAIDRGKPVHLWAASVGPFGKNPRVERQVAEHLRRYASISVRESATLDYLRGLGLDAVMLVADPAFTMTPEPHDHAEALFARAATGVLGFNVSPLVRGYLPDEEARAKFDAEIVDFLRDVVRERGLAVLLVPHVDPYRTDWNSDSAYMSRLAAAAGLPDDQLAILPRDLNAAQLKHALGRCRFVMGARTHATIGALSMGVPTISIAYSVKARGINRDLFGHEDVVLPTREVSRARLLGALDLLVAREEEFRALLAERLPAWRDRAREAAAPILG